jgi:hypothetical protein
MGGPFFLGKIFEKTKLTFRICWRRRVDGYAKEGQQEESLPQLHYHFFI